MGKGDNLAVAGVVFGALVLLPNFLKGFKPITAATGNVIAGIGAITGAAGQVAKTTGDTVSRVAIALDPARNGSQAFNDRLLAWQPEARRVVAQGGGIVTDFATFNIPGLIGDVGALFK